MSNYSFSDLEKISNNPTRVINEVLDRVENALGTDVEFNSPSHPFIVAMDMIVGQSWGLIRRHEDAVSKVYPYHSRNMADLGRNMADAQWYGMFSNPSTTHMIYVIPVSEIDRLAVEYTEVDGSVVNTYRKLVIPKDTRIKVVGTYFMVESPIEIRLMEHGGHSVVYDSTKITPFNPIETNILTKDYVSVKGVKFLRISIPVRQLDCKAIFNVASTKGAGLKYTYNYDDNLYGIRAFITRNGVRSELSIVYNNQVYDQTKPTLVIDLDSVNNKITCSIPDVYLNSGSGVGSVSILIYTSKGDFQQDLKTIQTKDHEPEYLDYDYDNGNLDKYSMPVRNASNTFWKTDQAVSGGSNPRSFESVRQAIIYGSRRESLPITPNQFSFNITDYGYSPVKTIDYLYYRLYLITKDLPLQTNKSFNSGVGVYVGDVLTTIDKLVSTGVVKDNGARITIPSGTLISVDGEMNEIVTGSALAYIKTLSDDLLVDYLKNNRMISLPFHYVLDTTKNQVEVRVYALDQPKINYQRFLFENTKLNIEVGVKSVTLNTTAEGYVLRVSETSGADWKALADTDVGLQLTYSPSSTASLASMKGTLIGRTSDKERVWEFNIPSNFDIDIDDNLYLGGFTQFGQVQDTNLTTLTNNFSLLFLKRDDNDIGVSESDLKINRTLFDTDFVAAVETTFNISFGSELSGMYTRARALVGDPQYELYEDDVPEVYGVNKYQTDANGELVFGPDDLPILEHKATDIVYNADGTPSIMFKKGTVKRNSKGEQIIVGPRKLNYHFTFIGFDAVYYFSNNAYDKEYIASINTYIQDIVMKDIEAFNARSLDETTLVFQPKVKIGLNDVVINEGVQTKINLDFSFKVIYYLTDSGNSNNELKTALRESTPTTINGIINANIVSISAVQKELVKLGGKDVLDVKVTGFLGSTEIDIASREDEGAGFSVKKLLELTTEGILSVKEDIAIDFKQHTVKNKK